MGAALSMNARSASALRCLLDTNVVIGLLKAQADCVALVKAADSNLANMAVSQITRMELFGFANLLPKDVNAIEQFLSAIRVLAISSEVEAQVIALRQEQKIKLPDAIVAATALAHGVELLTLDQSLQRVFRRVVSRRIA